MVDKHSDSAQLLPEAEVSSKNAAPLRAGPETLLTSMKVGVLTLPFNANIGGNLRGYALMEVLSGTTRASTVLINRRKPPKASVSMPAILRWIRDPSDLGFLADEPAHPDRAFLEEHAAPISREFLSSSQLSSNVDRYSDAIVVEATKSGDRNTRIRSARDFFSDFFRRMATKSRMIYRRRSEPPTGEYDDEPTPYGCASIRALDAVSVREDSGVALCRDHLGVDSQHVLDPTMLLTAEHYLSLFRPRSGVPTRASFGHLSWMRHWGQSCPSDTLSSRLSVKAIRRMANPFTRQIRQTTSDGDKSVEGWLAAITDPLSW